MLSALTILSPDISTPSKASSLLDLPAEIRNSIYRLVLVPPRPALHTQHITKQSPNLALIHTCRQIHSEAMPLFYSENAFSAHPSLLTSMPWLIHPARPICSPNVIRWIRRWELGVRLDCDARYGPEGAERAFNGMQELEIEAHEAMFDATGPDVLFVFKGIRGVGCANVRGSGKKSVHRWLEECMMAPLGKVMDGYDEWKIRKGEEQVRQMDNELYLKAPFVLYHREAGGLTVDGSG
ncbi:MAG: hypothetical protein M1828_005235 [Chrysothrix sp. TS-e1954]|nr:MAG: hypothetical protein M1828_005235 [Chrysothrix sp. TS-e1954]